MRRYVALDNCLSLRLMGVLDAMYGSDGFDFIHISKDLRAGTQDDEIWADSYRRFGGSIVLSGDARIAYRPHQHAAFIDNGLICYFPSKEWSSLRLHEQAAVIVHQWPGIARHLAENPNPACWRFACTGKRDNVHLRPSVFTRLEVPQEKLEAARQAKAGDRR